MPLTVLHVAPHPDDELLGAGATLLALRDEGHRVVNLACGLGEPHQQVRRRAELEEACRRAGFELVVHDPPLTLDQREDQSEPTATLERAIRTCAARVGAAIVVAPSPHDGHHGHEVVGAAACEALEDWPAPESAPVLWMWGLWADLPWPTLYSGFGDDLLSRAVHALEAHRGELERNDYRALARGRATANRCLGSERVFGFGSPMRPRPFAELLTEALYRDGEWWAGEARELDAADPLAQGADTRTPLGWWLRAPSFRSVMVTPG